jgi:hypothetical protein
MSITVSPLPTAIGRGCAERSPPAAPATRSSSPSSTGSRAPLPDARDIVDDLTRRQVKLNLGGSLRLGGPGPT